MPRGLLLKGATVVDAAGERSADVLVEAGRIARVGDVPGGDHEVVACQGRFLTPGLIDCHVHLGGSAGPVFEELVECSEAELAVRCAANAQATLRGGVTTARDLGGFRYEEFAVRDAIVSGLLEGPRLLVSGKPLTTPGGHAHFLGRVAKGEADLVEGAREQLRRGADQVKVLATGGVLTHSVDPKAAQFAPAELQALVAEVRRHGKRVAAHAHGAAGIEAAVEAGVASIEHGTYLTETLAERMAAKGTFYVVTASAPRGIVAGAGRGVPEDHLRKAEATLAHHKTAVQRALARGVRFAMGTDAGTPFNAHGDNARELGFLVEYGLSPAQALAAATTGAAALLGLEGEVGRVAPGFAADLLLLEGNPLDDLGVFHRRKPRVLRAGRWAA